MKIPILFMQYRTLLPGQHADVTPSGYRKKNKIRDVLGKPGATIGLVTVTSAKSNGIPEIGVTCEKCCTIAKVSRDSDENSLIVDVEERAVIEQILPDPVEEIVYGELTAKPYPPVADGEDKRPITHGCRMLNSLYDKLPMPPDDDRELRERLADACDVDALIAYIADKFRIGVPQLLAADRAEQRITIAKNMLAGLVSAADNERKKQPFKRGEREEKEEDDVALYERKIEELNAPDEVKEKLRKELNKYRALPPAAIDKHSIANYIELVLGLPWLNYSKDNVDLKQVAAILDEDHYGLEDVKERVLEYIAVRIKNPDGKAPILCLVGAPGVGKSSIARSIARAVGRDYVRMSLGGLSDEADIRGFRRTYVGSAPGRIIYSMSKVKYSNPLMLLDEIDKLAPSAARGNIQSALLEVLDPEQNNSFRDHYLELPYDLSKVFFLATANSLSDIPKPLLDRMEIIEISGYTQDEKLAIAQRYLVRKQLKECGLADGEVAFDDDSIMFIVEGYTRESGVRGLERKIGSVCRKIVKKQMLEGGDAIAKVDRSVVEEMLGVPPYVKADRDTMGEVGCVTGLAWTAAGGVTLPIEVRLVPGGKGETIMTGSLGDVMKESAEIALSVVRAHGATREEKTDVHIHVPEGATPKDGPSAGITMACALMSAFKSLKPRDAIAMTGELTLTGKVLKIGGLKEKLLAACRAGVKTVLIPKDNEPQLADIPDNIKSTLEIVPVEKIDEVFRLVFGD